MKIREMLKFEVHLTEHCNLNCKGCFHFSNIAEPEFLSVDEYRNDAERLSFLFENKAELILLLGGEPLLHKDLVLFFKITRNSFPNAKIGLVTNGILLPYMGPNFWIECHKYNITLMPTIYPIGIDYDSIERIADKYNVTIDYFNDKNEVKSLSVLSIDKFGKQNALENFLNCYRANFCITLEHGRLYTCIVPAHIRHYIKRFHLEMDNFLSDGIDIYKAKTAKEIQEFLIKPIRACAFCNTAKWRNGLKWERSKQSIEEWL